MLISAMLNIIYQYCKGKGKKERREKRLSKIRLDWVGIGLGSVRLQKISYESNDRLLSNLTYGTSIRGFTVLSRILFLHCNSL